RQRRAGEENPVHAVVLHDASVRRGDGAPATPKDSNVARAVVLQQVDDFGKELDVAAVVTGQADRSHVLLNRRSHDIAGGAMIPQVNDLETLTNEFQVDGVNGAIVP